MTDSSPQFPELYDLDVGGFTDDLPFYEALARQCEGPVLELGVGTGRAALHLARGGFDVWGIDSSDAMLERARGKAGAAQIDRLTLSSGDMRQFGLEQRFGMIFAGYGAFHHLLSTEDQLDCLRCVKRHLTPGGRFVCDLRPTDHDGWEEGESTPLYHDWTRVLPSTGETVMKLRSIRYDLSAQVKHETHVYDRIDEGGAVRRVVAEIDLRFTTRYEMERLLGEAGLELDRMYGDYERAPYDEASDYMITVARNPEEIAS